VSVIPPVSVPIVLGVKLTLIVQLAPGFTIGPQVVVTSRNGPLMVPVRVIVKFRIPRPELLSVMDLALLVVYTTCLGKVRAVVGESVTAGSTPTPVSGTFCNLLGALSERFTAALSAPATVGSNVTEIVQVAPPAIDEPQVLVWLKLEEFAPVIVMELKVRGISPVFISVILWGELDVATVWLPKAKLVGDSLAAAPSTTWIKAGEALAVTLASPL
jgi:hypothetical protein